MRIQNGLKIAIAISFIFLWTIWVKANDPYVSWGETCSIDLWWNIANWNPYFSESSPENKTVPCGNPVNLKSEFNLSDGIYSYKINTRDSFGNTSTSPIYWYNLDETPSICTITWINIVDTNQSHYLDNENRLYFKGSWAWTKATIQITVNWNEWGADGYVSWVKTITHPNALISGTNFTKATESSNSETTTFIGTVISTTTDTIIDLTAFECTDYANNKSNTTSVNIPMTNSWDETYTWTITWNLNVTADNTAPSIWNFTISNANSDTWTTTILDWSAENNNNHPLVAHNNSQIIISGFTENWAWFAQTNFKYNEKTSVGWSDTTTNIPNTVSTNSLKVTSLNKTISNINLSEGYCTWNRACKTYPILFESTTNTTTNTITDNRICDMVWNCAIVSNKTINVISANPVSFDINRDSGEKFANASDVHQLTISEIKDQYGNKVNSVSGIRDLQIDLTWTSELFLDMVVRDKNWVTNWERISIAWNMLTPSTGPTSNYTYTFTWDNDSSLWNWNDFDINISSYIPSDYNIGSTDSSNYYNTDGYTLDNLTLTTICNAWISNCWATTINDDAVNWWNVRTFEFSPIIGFGNTSNIDPLAKWVKKVMTFDSYSRSSWENLVSNLWLKTTIWANKSPFFLSNHSLNSNWTEKYWNTTTWVFHIWMWNYLATIPAWEEFTTISAWDLDWDEYELTFTIPNYSAITADKFALYSEFSYDLWTESIKMPWIYSGISYDELVEIDNWEVSAPDAIQNSDDIKTVATNINKIDISTESDNIEMWNWDLSNIKLYDIKSDIKKSVETLTKWFDKDSATWDYNLTTLTDFSSVPSQYIVNNDVLYFKWNVTLQCSSECSVLWKKTIIVDGWDLTIASDMLYTNNDSVLWLIVLDWDLLVRDNVANGVWVVYTSWAMMQVNNSGLVYGSTDLWSENALYNQLIWYGALATRNTLRVDEKVVWPLLSSSVDLSTYNWNTNRTTLEQLCPYGTKWYEESNCYQNYRALDLSNQRNHFMVDTDKDWTWDTPYWIYDWWLTSVKLGKVNYNDSNVETERNSKLRKYTNINAPIEVQFDANITQNPPAGFTN